MNNKELKAKLLDRLDKIEIEFLFNNDTYGLKLVDKERNRINNNE